MTTIKVKVKINEIDKHYKKEERKGEKNLIRDYKRTVYHECERHNSS